MSDSNGNAAEQRSIIPANPESLGQGERSKDMEVGRKDRLWSGGGPRFVNWLRVFVVVLSFRF